MVDELFGLAMIALGVTVTFSESAHRRAAALWRWSERNAARGWGIKLPDDFRSPLPHFAARYAFGVIATLVGVLFLLPL